LRIWNLELDLHRVPWFQGNSRVKDHAARAYFRQASRYQDP
jgi:hypothetical protein